jgi:hypothetical protein
MKSNCMNTVMCFRAKATHNSIFNNTSLKAGIIGSVIKRALALNFYLLKYSDQASTSVFF